MDDITAIIGVEKSIAYLMVNFEVFMIIRVDLAAFLQESLLRTGRILRRN